MAGRDHDDRAGVWGCTAKQPTDAQANLYSAIVAQLFVIGVLAGPCSPVPIDRRAGLKPPVVCRTVPERVRQVETVSVWVTA